MNLLNLYMDTIVASALPIGLQILGVIAAWIVGGWLINVAMRLVDKALASGNVDPTLRRYATSILSVLLKVVLVVAIAGFLGFDTTTFAALIAGAGLAIGTAWGGLLAHFAAGAFIVVLRPFKTGDFISAGGVVGTVEEIGMFVTTINTLDNVKTIVGNNKIFSDNIQNFTANPLRRVDLVAQLNHSVDYKKAIEVLKSRLAQIPNVSKEMPPQVDILEFNLAGPVLAVRPFTHNDSYWQVYFDTNAAIKEEFGKAGFPVPENHYRIRQSAA
ncbi:MAG: mechanosensitive ion channel family protein [Polyangiales bacterium]